MMVSSLLPSSCDHIVELRNDLRFLKGELVELINRDYAHFVNLSLKLLNFDGAGLLHMRTLLNDLRRGLSTFKEDANESLSAFQDGLRCEAQVSQARDILELHLDIFHSVSKMEKLLLDLKNMGSEPTTRGSVILPLTVERTTARSSLLERVGCEMNRLNFYAARVNAAFNMPAFVEIMEKSIKSANNPILDASLHECFEIGLKRQNVTVISSCLRAYAALDKTNGAHEVFRLCVVTPIIEQIFSSNTNASWPTSDFLDDDLNEIKRHIEIDCKFFLDIAVTMAANSEVVQDFDFLGSSILNELHNAIQKWKPGAFSPSKPSIFLVNYKASLQFLDYLECQYCPSRSSITTFRSQPAYTHFMKKWNSCLGVFFNLRFQEIAGELESALKVTSLGSNIADHDSSLCLALAPSVALERCLLKCWQKDMFVHSLSHKFLHLTLQLISRYSTWLLAGLEAEKSGHGEDAEEGALVASRKDFLLVKHDVELLVRMLKGPYLDSLTDIFQSSAAAGAVIGFVRDSIQEGADTLMKIISCHAQIMT